jgi:single-stranded DNA-binding protein
VQDATLDPGRIVQGRLLYTVRDVPGQVTAPTFVEGDQQVTVEWDTPAINGEPITQYTISWSGGSSVTVSGSTATHTFTGLTNGSPYTFQVRATNVVGQGEISDPSETARPFGAPSAATTATASGSTDGSGNVVLNWGGAAGNGRTIDGYRITMSPGGAVVNVGNVSTTTVPGQVGTAYSYSIVTLGAGGESSPFSSTNSGTPLPGAPANVTASWPGPRGSQTVNFSWSAAPSTAPITAYEFLVTGDSGWTQVPASQTSHTIQGAFNQSYSIQVRAISGGQTGSAGTSNAVTPLPVLPPSYSLCYHNDYSNYYNVGVNYANTSAGHTVRIDFASSSGVTAGASGQLRLRAWSARDTANDLNFQITIIVDGSNYSTTRWGDAPAC